MLTYPPLTETEYTDTFKTFMECSTEYAEMSLMVKKVIDGFEGRKVKMLSIGAGTGCVEDDLIKNHGLRLSFYYAVEPAKDHLVKLRSFVDSWNDEIPYVIDPSYLTPNFKTEHRFDFIMMSHSLYCIPQWRKILSILHKHLTPGGKFILFHQGGKVHPQIELYKHALLQPAPIADHTFTAYHIIDFLNEEHIKNSLHTGPSKMLVDDFIRGLETENSSHVIDFLLQTWYNMLSTDIQETIKNLVIGKTSKGKDGKHWMEHEVGMIVISN